MAKWVALVDAAARGTFPGQTQITGTPQRDRNDRSRGLPAVPTATDLLGALRDLRGPLNDLLGALRDLRGPLNDLLGALKDLLGPLTGLRGARQG